MANRLIAFQNSIDVQRIEDYFKHLQPELEREPDEREVFIHPETDILQPDTRERLLIVSPGIRLLQQLRASHISLHDLEWREFEQIVAELLNQTGYQVKLGPGSKDGGVDILASKYDPLIGFFVSVWQAKKLKQSNKVDIHVVRELGYVRLQQQATKGIIVTTTSLTKDALRLIEQEKYYLHKIDGNDLDRWIHKGLQA